MRLWEKGYTSLAMRKSLALLRAVDPDTHPDSKLVVDSATLVDKIRLIKGLPTENISFSDKAKSASETDEEIARLKAELGLDEAANSEDD
jgi:hypothetical protein